MELKKIIEGLLFLSGRPLTINDLFGIFMECSEGPQPSKAVLENTLQELQEEWEARESAILLNQVAQGYEFRSHPDYAPWLRLLNKTKPQRLSASAAETLAIVAYRQPLTRMEIENVRGVDAGGMLKSLLERRLVKIVGRKEEAGRPILYATSKEFLELFGLKDLNELPPLSEFEEMVKTQNAETQKAGTDFVVSDLLSTTEELMGLEEDEKDLLTELDTSLKNLKSVEKSALLSTEPITESSNHNLDRVDTEGQHG